MIALSGYFCNKKLIIILMKVKGFREVNYLASEILNDAVFRDLRADGEATLQLLLNARDHLVILFGSEALSSGQTARHGSVQCRHLEEPQSFIDVHLSGKRKKLHLSQRFRETNHSFKLPENDLERN